MNVLDPASIVNGLTGFGAWSGVALVVSQVIQVVVFWVPGTVFEVVGGMLFGPWMGTLLSGLGQLVGDAIAFGLARSLGKPWVDRWLATHRHPWLERFVHHPQLLWVLGVLFLLPAVPKDMFCYLAGVSGLGPRRFLVVTTVARLPALFLSSWLGSLALHERGSLFLVVLALSCAIAGAIVVYRKSLLAMLVRG